MALRFEKLHLAGWKSIKDSAIEFKQLNVLIGANGSGKSNLIGFFKLLNEMIGGRLQVHVAQSGGAESLLHYGSKHTQRIEAELRFSTDAGRNWYIAEFVPTRPTGLAFEREELRFQKPEYDQPFVKVIGRGHRESNLSEVPDEFETMAKFFRGALTRCRVFHFHDTSDTAALRRQCPIERNRHLEPDGGNAAAMLYLYRERHTAAYRRIVAAMRTIAPYFDDFVLEPLRLYPSNILLEWKAKGSDYVFGPHQLSDGTMRAVALATLLLQPEGDRPEMIILDEPELGLHPAALAVLADLLKLASERSRLLVATQSAVLLDYFEADDVLTVSYRDGASTFERLDPERLKHWLEEYTVSELWEQNVIGGGPY